MVLREQEVFPRRRNGIDWGTTGFILARGAGNLLVRFPYHIAWISTLEPRKGVPGMVTLIRDDAHGRPRSRVITTGGRITLERVRAEAAQIDAWFNLPGMSMHLDIEKTLVVDAEDDKISVNRPEYRWKWPWLGGMLTHCTGRGGLPRSEPGDPIRLESAEEIDDHVVEGRFGPIRLEPNHTHPDFEAIYAGYLEDIERARASAMPDLTDAATLGCIEHGILAPAEVWIERSWYHPGGLHFRACCGVRTGGAWRSNLADAIQDGLLGVKP